MEQKHFFTRSDKSIQELKYANYTSGLVRRFVDEFSCENTPYTKKSIKKDAKKSKLSGYKRIIREKKCKRETNTKIAQLILWLTMLLVSKILEYNFEYERYFQNVRKAYSEISNIRLY